MPRAAAALLLAVPALLAGGCGSSTSGAAASHSATPAAKPDVTVLMQGLKFAPKRFTIHKGQTVEWVDKDLVDHSVVAKGVESPDFAQGETWTHTFDRVGVFRYHDGLNPKMKGTLVVKR